MLRRWQIFTISLMFLDVINLKLVNLYIFFQTLKNYSIITMYFKNRISNKNKLCIFIVFIIRLFIY